MIDGPDLDAASFDLAQQMRLRVPPDTDGAALFGACCWILADLTVRAERDQTQTLLESGALILRNVLRCAQALEALRDPSSRVTH